MRRIVPLLVLAPGLFGGLAPGDAANLPTLTLQIRDLRPGYVQVINQTFSPNSVGKRTRVAASLLLSHGWQEGSQVLYRRTDNVRVQVGELADLFRGPAGGHWWFEASVAAVPTGYRTIGLPRVGEESVSVQSAAWTGVIFRRGASVVDVYVSSSAPEPPLSVLAIARLLDRRMEANPSTARLETQSRTPRPLAVHTWLRPKPLSDDGLHTLFARTSPGALCTARVVYMPNRLSKTFHGTPRRAGRDGRVQWSWREEIAAAYGSAFVTCSVGGRSTTGQMRFQVVP